MLEEEEEEVEKYFSCTKKFLTGDIWHKIVFHWDFYVSWFFFFSSSTLAAVGHLLINISMAWLTMTVT